MLNISSSHLKKFFLAMLVVLPISSCETSNSISVGSNLSSIDYFSSQLPFVNEFKSSQNWLTQTQKKWDTKEEHLLDKDSHGWVKSLPADETRADYTKVSTLLFRDHGNYLPGTYFVLYEGEGKIEYKFDAKKNEVLSTVGRDVIEVNPSTSGILVSITSTDPHQTGDYIRNIRVVHETYQSVANREIFNPKFLENIQPFDTLRFMDWMKTNNSEQKNWVDRPKPTDARYSDVGMPVEIMVELANRTDTNPWFTMPHQATDEYVTNFARYVRDHLKPNLKVYVEYSNEAWNWQFQQTKWIDRQAKQEWSDSDLNRFDWYSRRTTEIVQIWDEVFDRDSERVIGVMASQAANVWIGERILDYKWSNTSLSHSDTGIDAIAIAPYFGGYIGNPKNENELESWTKELDGGLNKLFQELTEGGLLENSSEGGALTRAYTNIKAYAKLAKKEKLQLLAYEGGQHLVGTKGLENNEAITNLFIEANRDLRMGIIYRDYLEQWFNLGGNLFVNFIDIGIPTKWGSWGTLESVYQDSSPKYDAIVNFINQNNADDEN